MEMIFEAYAMRRPRGAAREHSRRPQAASTVLTQLSPEALEPGALRPVERTLIKEESRVEVIRGSEEFEAALVDLFLLGIVS